MNIKDNRVAVDFIAEKNYPEQAPFDPPERFPEYQGKSLNPGNQVYSGVRSTLFHLGLDQENYGAKEWNPFKDLIKPGMKVFIKPNTVVHEHERGDGDVMGLIVHASILRPILDYVCIALKGEGEIVIGDSQLIYSNFDKALRVSKTFDLVNWYNGNSKVQISCLDLRTVRSARSWLYGRWKRIPVEQDPRGYQFVDLGDLSYFRDIDPKRLRIAIAGHKNMYKHHSGGKHEYLFPRSVLESDVIISIAKLKTHRRTGVTLALKNFMGIPALKDSLPHFITGSVEEGGDQYIYPSLRKRIGTRLHDEIQSNPFMPVKFVCAVIKKLFWESNRIIPFKDDVYEAMWYGNDTIWRTLLDLNRAVLYADKEGKIRETQQRGFFGLIDGIKAGEKDGPLCADCVLAGVLLAGFNPVTLDAVGATAMGFDVNKIPLISRGIEDSKRKSPIFIGVKEGIEVIEGPEVVTLAEFSKRRYLSFEPHPSWKGHIEMDESGN